MTQPKLISGETLRHTPEALAARAEGLIIAKCTITCMGEVRDCRIVKGLPFMNQVTLAVLESRRYHPARYLGRPMSVSYFFHVKLKLPEEEPASLSPCGLDSYPPWSTAP
jgi:protein TonB